MTPLTNDHRAVVGIAAVEAAVERNDLLFSEHDADYEPEIDDAMVTSIEDTLACLAHTCDRFGIDSVECFADALKRHDIQVLMQGKAHTIADGDRLSIAEIREQRLQGVEQ